MSEMSPPDLGRKYSLLGLGFLLGCLRGQGCGSFRGLSPNPPGDRRRGGLSLAAELTGVCSLLSSLFLRARRLRRAHLSGGIE